MIAASAGAAVAAVFSLDPERGGLFQRRRRPAQREIELYGENIELVALRKETLELAGLLADLNAHQPRIPATMQALRPKVEAIAMQRRGHGWQALPNISDGHETYELVLTVAQTRGRWLVSTVSSPR